MKIVNLISKIFQNSFKLKHSYFNGSGYWGAKWEECRLRWGVGLVRLESKCSLNDLLFQKAYSFSYLAGVAKRTFNFFYHFDFIYKNSPLYQTDRRYTEIAERLPCRVSICPMELAMELWIILQRNFEIKIQSIAIKFWEWKRFYLNPCNCDQAFKL